MWEQLVTNYLELKQPDKADAAYVEKYTIVQQRDADKPANWAWVQMDWAEWNLKAERFAQARTHLKQATDLMPKNNQLDLYFQIRLALDSGDAALGLRDYTSAEKQYKQAIINAEKSKDDYDRLQCAIAQEKLASVLRIQGRSADAVSYETQAKAIRDSLAKSQNQIPVSKIRYRESG